MGEVRMMVITIAVLSLAGLVLAMLYHAAWSEVREWRRRDRAKWPQVGKTRQDTQRTRYGRLGSEFCPTCGAWEGVTYWDDWDADGKHLAWGWTCDQCGGGAPRVPPEQEPEADEEVRRAARDAVPVPPEPEPEAPEDGHAVMSAETKQALAESYNGLVVTIHTRKDGSTVTYRGAWYAEERGQAGPARRWVSIAMQLDELEDKEGDDDTFDDTPEAHNLLVVLKHVLSNGVDILTKAAEIEDALGDIKAMLGTVHCPDCAGRGCRMAKESGGKYAPTTCKACKGTGRLTPVGE